MAINASVKPSGFFIYQDEAEPLQVVLQQTHSAAVLLVFVFGSLINCVVLVLFYLKPTVRSFSNRFVINMTITNMLSCLLVTPYVFTTSFAGRWLFGDVCCQVCGAASLVLSLATVLSLLLIAVDRNCAVSSPLHYSMTVTKSRTGWLIISVWLLALASVVPPFLVGGIRFQYRPNWNMCTLRWEAGNLYSVLYSAYLFSVGFALPFIKITWIYCSMFRAAKQSSARTGRQRSISSSITETSSSDLRVSRLTVYKRPKATRKNSHQGIFGEEWKAARTGLIILFSFFLCWFPYFSVFVFESWFGQLVLPAFLPPACVLLCLSAAVVNPYIYVFRNKTTRKLLLKFLRCERRKTGNGKYCVGHSRTIHGRTLLPVQASSSSSHPFPDGMYAERPTTLWRLVTYVDEETSSTVIKDASHIGDESMADEPIFFTESRRTAENTPSDNKRLSVSQQPVDLTMEETGRSVERLFFKFRRFHRDSTTSDSTDNGCASFDSVTTEDFRPYEFNTARGGRPPLKRVRSVIEEQELYAGILMSRYGRRESVGAFRISSQESSETTLTSSTSTESQDQVPIVVSCSSSNAPAPQRTKPKLIRQQSTAFSETKRYEEGALVLWSVGEVQFVTS